MKEEFYKKYYFVAHQTSQQIWLQVSIVICLFLPVAFWWVEYKELSMVCSIHATSVFIICLVFCVCFCFLFFFVLCCVSFVVCAPGCKLWVRVVYCFSQYVSKSSAIYNIKSILCSYLPPVVFRSAGVLFILLLLLRNVVSNMSSLRVTWQVSYRKQKPLILLEYITTGF